MSRNFQNLLLGEKIYSIFAPYTFRSNENYTLSLTIHNAPRRFVGPAVLKVSIEDQKDPSRFQIRRHVAMNPGITELISIPIGDVPVGGDYQLIVKGANEIAMEHKANLHLETRRQVILIQTDKAIYKPKDVIRFRVLVLDVNLKPVAIENNELKIDITDPCKNLLKKWNGVNTTSGVFSGEFQLSDLPKKGLWEIKACYLDQMQTSIFEVAEYVLPKFEVEIHSPGIFMPEEKTAHVVLQAKYTHGQPMKGTVDADIHFRRRTVHKSLDINGKGTIEFDIENELEFEPNEICKNYTVFIKVTENLTGLSQSCETKFEVNRTYVIRTHPGAQAKLKRDSIIDFKISVRRPDGSVPNFDGPWKREIIVVRHQFYDGTKQSTKTTTAAHQLNESGDVVLKWNIDKSETSFSVEATYATQETYLGQFSTFVDAEYNDKTTKNTDCLADELRLESGDLQKQYYINKPVKMEVITNSPVSSYTYVVVSNGKIFESKTITPIYDDSYKTLFVHCFSFVPHSGYASRAQITVCCVKDYLLHTSSFSIDLRKDTNSIELDIDRVVAKPGDMIDIKIKSNKNAFIGLLGMDRSALVLRKGNDLDRKMIQDEVLKTMTVCLVPFHSQFHELILFSNIQKPKIQEPHVRTLDQWGITEKSVLHAVLSLRGGGGPPQPTYKREFFPETWIWETIDSKDFDGSMTLTKKVPDSLTSWVLTGFSIDPVNGLSLVEAPLQLKVQQPFYISLKLPYSVKRGEILTIPCSIFNHFPNDIEAEVTLQNEHDEFEFVNPPGKKAPKRRKVGFQTKKSTVSSDDAANVYFTIRQKIVGVITLKVTAVSSAASDCVINTLNVECEGVSQFVNKAVLINLRKQPQTDSIDLIVDVPKHALPDSERIEVTCVGDLLGGTIENLHQLIRLPCGCGEQNMLNFVPNIVVLNYLKYTNQLSGEIKAKAIRFTEIGYATELQYKHKDGSFSTFGERYNKSGITWLTAFVAKSFQQASEYIHIEEHIIEAALKWLSNTQSPNGSFVEKGDIFDKEMQSGAANGVALTAYVLTAFLVNEKSKATYKTTIQKAIGRIITSVKGCSDAYALSVCAYALQLAAHTSAKDVLDRLNGLASKNRQHKWWEKTTQMNVYGEKQSKTLNVEITAYALLTLLLNGEDDSDMVPIVKWLLNQRNNRGGFEGTQDTIIGIEALANFAMKTNNKGKNANVGIKTSGGQELTFDVNENNALVLQSQKLEPDTKWISMNATGNGFALVELGYRYHVNAPDAEAAFLLEPHGKLLDEDNMSLQTKVSYKPPAGKGMDQQTNMVIMEVSLPSGFVVNMPFFDSLKKTIPIIKRTETKNDDTVAIIYFEYLTSKVIDLKIVGYRKHKVTEQKPTPIIIYDYYDNALSAREFYSLM